MCVASDNHEADIVALIRSLGQIQLIYFPIGIPGNFCEW